MISIEEKLERDRKKSLKYRNSHLEECRERCRKWQQKNVEYIKKYKKKYRIEHKNYIIEYNVEWRTKNKEYNKNRIKKWIADNYYHVLVYNRARQSKLKILSDGSITNEAILSLLGKQNSICLMCGKDISNCYTLDHIKPISKGGTNSIFNIQLLCKSCNCKKGNRE